MLENIKTCTDVLKRNVINEQQNTNDLYNLFKELHKKGLITEKEINDIEKAVI